MDMANLGCYYKYRVDKISSAMSVMKNELAKTAATSPSRVDIAPHR
jgi:hypothetical protein